MTKLVDIVLPQEQLEGTSATLASWLVKENDRVKSGDPVAELETDKVVMEVCATETGRVNSLLTKVGDKVEPDQVLGTIDMAAVHAQAAESGSAVQAEVIAPASSEVSVSMKRSAAVIEPATIERAHQASQNPDVEFSQSAETSASGLLSPAVRRLLRQNSLDSESIPGSGKHGRVTRDDVLKFLKQPAPELNEDTAVQPKQSSGENKMRSEQSVEQILSTARPAGQQPTGLAGEMVAHSKIRKSIASHMTQSLLHTSPHVTSVFEMDMGNIIEHRKWHKKEYQALGVNLTFTAYFLAAMVKGVKAVPQVNARFHEEALEIFKTVNIGVGTALGDAGLVVPVVDQVQDKSLFEIARCLNQQTAKAREGKLTPADMANGTFTISNHGISGSLFATPIIINQPQVAILGVGKMEKRVVVETVNGEDNIVIRPRCYVSLSIDHRALDAHQTNQFLTVFVAAIETWGE